MPATAQLKYHFEPEGWWAESPEFPGYSAFGASLFEVRLLAHEGLRFYAEDESLVVVDPIMFLEPIPVATAASAPDEMPDVPIYKAARPRLQFTFIGESEAAKVTI